MKKSEDNIRDLQNNIKESSSYIIEVPGREKEIEAENVFEKVMKV